MKGKPQGQAKGAVGQGLFLQPLGGGKHQGELGDIHPKGGRKFGCHHLQPSDGKAWPEVKYGRNPKGLTDCLKFWSCKLRRLRSHKAAVFQAA